MTGGEQVFLDESPVPAHASTVVTVTEPTTYTLRIGLQTKEVTLAPYPELAITELTTSFAQPTAEAGQELVINWSVQGADVVSIVEVVTGGQERASVEYGPETGTATLQFPLDKREANFRITATNPFGSEESRLLFADNVELLGWVCQDPEDVITVADPHLAAEIWTMYDNTYLDDGTGVLTCLMAQTAFDPLPLEEDEYGLFEQHSAVVMNRCDQTEDPIIASLEGIQHFRNLLRLELMCNQIEDISRLAGLTGLQELNLDRNSVSDLSPLAGLADLRILGLYQNEVSDVTPLAGLTDLQVLYLSENRVLDVSPLAGLTSLEHLWLYLNCRTVEPDLSVWADCLQDVSALSGLHNLRSAVFHMNEIQEVGFLNADMVDLELVFASQNAIADISPLAAVPALSTARLDTNLIANIAALAANPALPSTAEPFYWERIDPGPPAENRVTMPVGSNRFTEHISLHDNCLDVTSPDLAADLATLRDRGATVNGEDVAQMARSACTPGELSSLGTRGRAFDPAGLLREDSRWFQNR